eukprot:GCRY01003292.1.p1 GENE.GCRY01003292.1~~GCRY01003292.1.p1  ORF type:complete len:230 (-),score=23.32 GCRY01003292.1:167-856(-)
MTSVFVLCFRSEVLIASFFAFNQSFIIIFYYLLTNSVEVVILRKRIIILTNFSQISPAFFLCVRTPFSVYGMTDVNDVMGGYMRPLTEASRDQLLVLFKFADEDKDGIITYTEALGLYRELGYHFPPNMLDEYVETGMDFDNFCSFIEKEQEKDSFDAYLERLFNLMDRQGCGRVNAEQLSLFVRELGYNIDKRLLDDFVDELERPVLQDKGFSFIDFQLFVKRNDFLV